jgi:hypothetical protein
MCVQRAKERVREIVEEEKEERDKKETEKNLGTKNKK